jgi:cytochrome c oxidase subunit 4
VLSVNAPPAVAREEGTHVVPAKVLLGTAAALLALTATTVVTSRIDLGSLNIVLALAIAVAKAALVAAFFMHLKYERPFQTVVFVTAAFFAAVLVGLVVFDTVQYQPDVREAGGAAKARAGAEPAR